MSVLMTREKRPDLLAQASLTKEDVATLRDNDVARLGRNFSFCLVHNPVLVEKGIVGTSSLTNLDIHDIARVSTSYGLGPLYVVTPLLDQQRLLESILTHWCSGKAKTSHPDRAKALQNVRCVSSLSQVIESVQAYSGERPTLLASSAKWTQRPMLVAHDVRNLLRKGSVVFCLGTAQGLADEALDMCDGLVRPIRFLDYNHLSVRSAAAIYADRILGDFD